jgi:molybdate transport repressor ModE-like protein
MARLRPLLAWRTSGRRGRTVDARVVDLVAGVDRLGSLAAAARELGLPYRTAWALMEEAERDLKRPLVDRARGVGAGLAPLGRRLLDAQRRGAQLLAAQGGALDVSVGPRAAARPDAPLRIAASHDLVLAQLRDRWLRSHRIELAFCGSAEAIDRYVGGGADVAGFHVELRGQAEPVSDTGDPLLARKPGSDPDPLLAKLDPDRDQVLPFVIRTQGLILPAGNPRQVATFADVARFGLRFVNRQPGSGTRIAIERRLALEGVAAGALDGWTTEEFTHAAVAATVAAGRAEAGFGIQAAAAQLGLAFVPLVDERYAFALRRAQLGDARVRGFLALMRSPAVERVAAPLPGYRFDARPAAKAR